MKTVRFLAMLWLPFLAAGCVSDVIDEGAGTGQNGEIRFEIGFADRTRVATGADFTSAWEDGDEIGIFAVANGSPLVASGNYIHNVKLTYDKTENKWTPAEPQYWPQSGKLDFYAYYPYDANATDPTAIVFSVSADQSASGAFGASDLLAAKSDNGGAGWAKGSTVALTFTHSLALVQVDITDRGAGVPEYDAGSLTVKMHGVQTSATLDLSGGTAVAGGNAESVVMMRVDTGVASEWIYRALVPSQTVASGAVLFTFEQDLDGDFKDFRLVYCPSQARTLAAGEYTEFDIKADWGDSKYAETRRFIEWAQLTDGWQTSDFTLTGDIDLTGYDWKPVSDYMTPFTRTFDGGGHSITGLSVNSNTVYVGLFGVVGSGGKVQNVSVSGTVKGTKSNGYVGGIAGRNNHGATITDCTFSGTVTGTGDSVGGITGYNSSSSTITGCSVGENSTITATSADSNVGGIAGYNQGSTITGCSFSGTVTVTGGSIRVGGIAGYNSGGGTITGCSSSSTVLNADSDYRRFVGGIVGSNSSGSTITGSWSAAQRITGMSSDSYVGGIAGENYGSGNIRYCHWLWNDPTGFGGNAVGVDGGTTSGCSSFATVSALNGYVDAMNTAITAAGITDWQWVEGADPATNWPTIQKLP